MYGTARDRLHGWAGLCPVSSALPAALAYLHPISRIIYWDIWVLTIWPGMIQPVTGCVVGLVVCPVSSALLAALAYLRSVSRRIWDSGKRILLHSIHRHVCFHQLFSHDTYVPNKQMFLYFSPFLCVTFSFFLLPFLFLSLASPLSHYLLHT